MITELRNWRACLLGVAMLGIAPMIGLTGCRNSARSLPDVPYSSLAAGALASDCQWACAIDEQGLPNFHRVSDDLYRGGQPTAEGFRQLPALGIKTIVNVRESDTDHDFIIGVPLAYVQLPTAALHMTDDVVIRFLQLMSDQSNAPVFVHCKHGADRTGALCAMYRVAVQGWSKDDAIAEMTRGGMLFNSVCQNLIAYVRDADVEELRRQAGIVRSAAVGGRLAIDDQGVGDSDAGTTVQVPVE